MNYGYDDTASWSDAEKYGLAEALDALCANFPDRYGMHPYTEVDTLYAGVRIRRITHLTEEEQQELVRQADVFYEEWRLAHEARLALPPGSGKSHERRDW